jgi:hypothetical protein
MAIAAQLYRDARWEERHHVDLAATLRDLGGSPIDIVIEDVSRSGFCIAEVPDLSLGAVIGIGVQGADRRRARVVWRAHGNQGLEFLQPLSQAELEIVLSAPAFEATRLDVPGSGNVSSAQAVRLSYRARTMIIVGTSLMLWCGIIATLAVL